MTNGSVFVVISLLLEFQSLIKVITDLSFLFFKLQEILNFVLHFFLKNT